MNGVFACVYVFHPRVTASSRNYEHKVRRSFSFFVFAALSAAAVCESPCPPSSECVAAAMVQQQPHFKAFFATATNGVAVRVRVCVSVCHPEHHLKFMVFRKAPWHSDISTAAVQQAANLTQAHIHIMCTMHEGTPSLSLAKLRHARDLKSITSRRGTLYLVQYTIWRLYGGHMVGIWWPYGGGGETHLFADDGLSLHIPGIVKHHPKKKPSREKRDTHTTTPTRLNPAGARGHHHCNTRLGGWTKFINRETECMLMS